jgi:hypothetical protein
VSPRVRRRDHHAEPVRSGSCVEIIPGQVRRERGESDGEVQCRGCDRAATPLVRGHVRTVRRAGSLRRGLGTRPRAARRLRLERALVRGARRPRYPPGASTTDRVRAATSATRRLRARRFRSCIASRAVATRVPDRGTRRSR